MKSVMNTKAALLVAASLFAGSAAFAQEQLIAFNGKTPAHNVAATADDAASLKMDVAQGKEAGLTFHINVDNPNLERVKLYLLDKSGTVLHEEELPAKAHYQTRYNLDQLEDGSYKIVLSSRSKDIERAVNIATSVSRSGKVN